MGVFCVGLLVLWRKVVCGRAGEAAEGMLAGEDPATKVDAVGGCEEGFCCCLFGLDLGGRRRRRSKQVDGADDEEAEGEARAVHGGVVMRQESADAALPVAEVARRVEGRIVRVHDDVCDGLKRLHVRVNLKELQRKKGGKKKERKG